MASRRMAFAYNGAAIALAAGLLAACVSPAAPTLPAKKASPASVLPASAEEGRYVAERYCAACHAIGPFDQSPSGFAPPFRALRMRYNPIALDRHITDLAGRGYYGMPPQPISAEGAKAVAAYIETLR